MRKLSGIINKTNTVVIFINQIREKVGVMFGNPETTSGGRALKFYATIRIDIRRVQSLKQGEDVIGNDTRIKVVKNKVAPPFKQVSVELLFGEGISRYSEIIDLAVAADIIQKSGSWFSYDGEQLGQGKDTVKKLLMKDEELTKKLEAQVRDYYKAK